MVDLPPRALTVPVRTSLPVWLPIVLASGSAVTIGVLGGLRGGSILLAVVGLAGLVLAVIALFRPPTLVLDAEGLALRTPLGERWRRPWAECEGFRVHRGFVVWTSPAEAARHPRQAAGWRKKADADAGLMAQFGGLPPTDLAALLTRYRQAADTPLG